MLINTETQEPGASDIVVASVVVDESVDIRDNAEPADVDTSTIDESVDDKKDESTPDAPAKEDEEPDFDIDAILSETDGDSSEASTVKPLDFIEKLPAEDQKAYAQQVEGLSKLVARDAKYREVAGTHDVEQIKAQIETGRGFIAIAAKLTNPTTRIDAISELLEEFEDISGQSLEEMVPERFGFQVPQEQLELMGRERRLAIAEEKQANIRKQNEWSSSQDAKNLVVAFQKQAGFTLDPAKVAPHVLAGDSPLQAVRKAHPVEWEKHLFELGKKRGLKESRAKNTTDLPVDRKSVSGVEYYESGPFKGQIKPR